MKFKKLTSVILSAVMICPAVVQAVPTELFSVITATAEDIVDSGTCGERITWELDSEGTLTISGEGEMNDYECLNEPLNEPPWGQSTAIKKIIVKDGVTRIGDYSFYFCKNVSSVELPDTVTDIGARAFNGITSLKTIVFPKNLKKIGNYAFYYSGLEELELPESVAYVGAHAFQFTEWYLNDANWCRDELGNIYVISGGFLFEAFGLKGDVTIPNSVKFICDDVFSGNSDVQNVIIPESVEYIGKAFELCPYLHFVTIQNPDCEIYDSEKTFSQEIVQYPDFTSSYVYNGVMCGYENSTAQKYAKKYFIISYWVLDEDIDSTTTTTTASSTTTTTATTTTTTAPKAKTPGDANLDGNVSVADAVAIMQFLGNKDKYAYPLRQRLMPTASTPATA